MQQAVSPTARSACAALLADYESLWRCFDQLVARFGPEDWARKHGKDWTYADVPYHLAYFERDVVLRPIERGDDVPRGEQRVQRTMRELNAWNAERFAQRPAGQTPEQSLAEMRSSREAIRRLLLTLTDADLGRRVFIELGGAGWVPAGMALTMGRGHTWGELTALRLRMGCAEPLPSPSATHAALDMYMQFLPMAVNKEQAAKTRLITAMVFTGPGGGSWTVDVAGGRVMVTEGRPARADLTITQSPDTFIKTRDRMHHPMLAMLTGKMMVKGMRKMGTFGKLFPPPAPDTAFPAGFGEARPD